MIKFEFISQGVQLEEEGEYFFFIDKDGNKKSWDKSRTLILDTGNRLMPGVVDHHQSGAEDVCASYLVATEPAKYLGHLRGNEDCTIVTHFIPDLDAALSAYIAHKFISDKEITEADQLLSEFSLDVDTGRYTFDLDYPVSLASLMTAIVQHALQRDIKFHEKNELILEESFRLFEAASNVVGENKNPWAFDFAENLVGFDNYKAMIHADREQYRRDVETSHINQFPLLNYQTDSFEIVDFICSKNPKSFLWKYWVRGDKNNSPGKSGFIFTALYLDEPSDAVVRGKSRTIISVDPNLPYNLKGLGVLIDSLEINKIFHNKENPELDKNPREGFHRDDPWFDGRGSHNYTIIDAPKSGSHLELSEIMLAISATEYWQKIGEDISRYLQSFKAVRSLETPVRVPAIDHTIQKEFVESGIFEADNLLPGLADYLKVLFMAGPVNSRQKVIIINSRQAVFEKAIEVYQELPDHDSQKWLLQISEVFLEWMTPKYIRKWLLVTQNINEIIFKSLIGKAVLHLPDEELLPYLMHLKDNQSEGCKELARDAFKEGLQPRIKLSADYFYVDDLPLFPLTMLQEYPLYNYRHLKEYVSDILYASKAVQDGKTVLDLDIEWFFQNSLEDMMGDQVMSFEQIQTFDNRIERIIQEHLLIPVLGVQFLELRKKRSEVLKEISSENFYQLKKITVSDIRDMDFQVLHNLIVDLRGSDHNSEALDDYLDALQYLMNIRLFQMVHDRLISHLKIKVLAGSNEHISTFFRESNYNLYRFTGLLSNLIEAQYGLYYQSESGIFLDRIVKFTTQLKKLAGLDYSVEGIEKLAEEMYIFLSRYLEEQELSLNQSDRIIELCFEQLAELKKSEYLNGHAKDLPSVINHLTMEIFSQFRRYYLEKISFLQNDLQSVLEKDKKAGIESSYYERLGNKILQITIVQDWYEYKESVLKASDSSTRNKFFKKYFHWLLQGNSSSNAMIFNGGEEELEIQTGDSQNDLVRLSELNSKIRFAAVHSKSGIQELVKKLPEAKSELGMDDYRNELQKEKNPLIHANALPYSTYYEVYDYLTERYVSNYDVGSVSNSLFNFSSRFPSYVAWFSRTNNLRSCVFLLIAFLFLLGVFDPTIYEFENSQYRAPLSDFALNFLGVKFFNIVSGFLKFFWTVFIGIAFIAPIVYVIYTLLWNPIKNRIFNYKNDDSFSFLKTLGKIELKSYKLLYMSFIIPLLLVVMQMSKPGTISMISQFEGIRLVSMVIIIFMLTVYSIYLDVKKLNPEKPEKWVASRVNHMFWLYTLQSLILTIFVIDFLLRFQLDISMFQTPESLISLGISRYIVLEYQWFDVVVMPVFTVIITFLTLFISFFINRVFSN